jgi:hypothetical protein
MLDAFRRSLLLIIIAVLAGCTSTKIALDYKPSNLVADVEPEDGKVRLGQFADRRGKAPRWLGEIKKEYYYPKETLEADRPVTLIVRDMIKEGAEERGLLSVRNAETMYQLYGQILELGASVSERTDVSAHLMIRLLNLEDNKEVHHAVHRVELGDHRLELDTDKLADLLEDALNQAVAASLDDPALRETLQ